MPTQPRDPWVAVIMVALWLPSLLWAWMVFKTPAALALTLPLAASIVWVCRASGRAFRAQPPLAAGQWIAILVFSMGWSAFTGLPHLFTINVDWLTRLETLSQFKSQPWQQLADPGQSYLFRFPGAYYALVALFSDWLEVGALRVLLWLGTALACALGLLALFRQLPSRGVWAFLLAFVCINGFDLLGAALMTLARGTGFPSFGTHIEWWSGFQYSGLSTAIIWVPNHLLPAMLFCALLPLSRESGAPTPARLVLLGAAAVGTIFWSPLVFVGALPLLVAELVGLIKAMPVRQVLAKLPPVALALLAAGTLIMAWYITLDTGAIRKGSFLSTCQTGTLMCSGRLGLFYLLEALPLAGLCWLLPNPLLGRAAALTLLALPLFSYGPNNDMLMRASLPAIVIAAFSLAGLLQRQATRFKTGLAYGLVLLAGYCAAGELWRGLQGFEQPRWQAVGFLPAFRQDFQHSLDNGYPNHYLAPVDKACAGYRREILRGCP